MHLCKVEENTHIYIQDAYICIESKKIRIYIIYYLILNTATQTFVKSRRKYAYLLLRVSEANEVPISSHIWVGLSTFNWL